MKFFNDNGRFGYVSRNSVKPFTGETDFQRVVGVKSSRKISKFTPKCLLAIHEAKFFMNLPVESRTGFLDECVQQNKS